MTAQVLVVLVVVVVVENFLKIIRHEVIRNARMGFP